MVDRAVVTVGVSTERGAVHAVVLADSGERLPERILLHRVERTRGDTKADVAAAVQTAMDEVAAEIGPRNRIVGTAVAYRDAAERRAIVTRLASGPWHATSLVSTKSAHLSLAAMMTWLDEFDHLLICEVVPGYQSFTLVDRARTRVLAATSQAGIVTQESLGLAVTAAWDQLEAAAARPDAVVLIGSASDAAVVREALHGLGAPVLPCPISVSAPAAGAALAAIDDSTGGVVVTEPEQARYGRGTAALLAAASVLAGGLLAGGVYTMDTMIGSDRPMLAEGPAVVEPRGVARDEPTRAGNDAGIPTRPSAAAAPAPQPVAAPGAETPRVPTPSQWWIEPATPRAPQAATTPKVETEPEPESAESAPPDSTPGSEEAVAPDGSMLFPGENPPPPAFTPEAQQWWDNHFRLLMEWASEQLSLDPAPEQATPEPPAVPEQAGPVARHAAPELAETQAEGERVGRHAAGRHHVGRHAVGRHAVV